MTTITGEKIVLWLYRAEDAETILKGTQDPTVHRLTGTQAAFTLDQIECSRYFIALIGKTTLASPYVLQEIEWALESNCTLISVLHNGAYMDETAPESLKNRHAISVTAENALGYETAVNQLLNSLGYATY